MTFFPKKKTVKITSEIQKQNRRYFFSFKIRISNCKSIFKYKTKRKNI